MIHLSDLPLIDAVLNSASAVLLVLGYIFIRRGWVRAHQTAMIGATLTSTVFLGCYLYYHAHHGVTKFPGTGFVRSLYFAILFTHTILAGLQVPLILRTLYWAAKGEISRHKAIARLTLPIWVYVSVTGVVIYVMLYQIKYDITQLI